MPLRNSSIENRGRKLVRLRVMDGIIDPGALGRPQQRVGLPRVSRDDTADNPLVYQLQHQAESVRERVREREKERELVQWLHLRPLIQFANSLPSAPASQKSLEILSSLP